MFKSLKYPHCQDICLDSPQRSAHHRHIILEKPFLRNIYHEWYDSILKELPPGPGQVLELGSGAGFLKDRAPQVLASDIMRLQDLDLLCSAKKLPFQEQSLKAVIMLNVLHHIQNVQEFFQEASRSLLPSGRIILIEPWMSTLGRFIYHHLHHEPCSTETSSWSFSSGGPLSGANVALAWIVFHRDRSLFEHLYPELDLQSLRLEINFRYLFSGGLSYKSFLPSWTYSLVARLEALLPARLNRFLALFAYIVLEKKTTDPGKPGA